MMSVELLKDSPGGTNGSTGSSNHSQKSEIDGMIGISSKFAVLNHLITRDLNNVVSSPTFSVYSKDDIQTYLSNPYNSVSIPSNLRAEPKKQGTSFLLAINEANRLFVML